MEYSNPLLFDSVYTTKSDKLESSQVFKDENFPIFTNDKFNYTLASSLYYNPNNLLQEQNSQLQNQFKITDSKILKPDFYTSDVQYPTLPMQQNKKVPFQFSSELQAQYREQLQAEKLAAQTQETQATPEVIDAIKTFYEIENDSEDEGIEDYKIGGYHPVHVGEVLLSRYMTIQKLGWGHFSTVWLCKDFKYDTYVAVKVQKSAEHYIEAAYDEVEVLQKVAAKAYDSEWIQNLKNYKKDKILTRDDCHVVQLLNSFVHKGPYGNHFCMVFEILGVNLLEIIKRYEFKGIPLNICKKIAKQTLIGLDYLHRICGVIHTDLKPENVLIQLSKEEIKEIIENGQLAKNQIYKERLEVFHKSMNIFTSEEIQVDQKIEEPQQFSQIQQTEAPKLNKTQKKNMKRRQQKKKQKEEKQQIENSDQNLKYQEQKTQNQQIPQNQSIPNSNIPQPITESTQTSYKDLFQLNKEKISFKTNKPLPNDFQIKVADLGNACWTHHHFSTLIQTRQYRSPETIIGTAYNETADTWSFACMLFELMTGDFLFEPRKGGHFSKNDDHLAQMQELVGRFPVKLTQSSLKSKRYFNKDGSLRRIPILNCWSLENVLIEKYKFKLQEAKELASFMLPMLNPYPHRRAKAIECLQHPWLHINGDETYNGRMTEDELKQWQLEKENLIQNDLYKPHTRPKFYESEEDDGDNSETKQALMRIGHWKNSLKLNNPIVYKGVQPRKVEISLIDRSFTDLGYIGFEQGIDTQQLDSTGNWQFIN